jgi:hypothetical protein
MVWKQRKHGKQSYANAGLEGHSLHKRRVVRTAPWRLANSPALAVALPNAYFALLGLPCLFDDPA